MALTRLTYLVKRYPKVKRSGDSSAQSFQAHTLYSNTNLVYKLHHVGLTCLSRTRPPCFGTARPLPVVSTARGSLNCHSSQLLAFLINRIPFPSSTQTFILVAIKQIWFVGCQITPLMKTMCVESRATVTWGRNVSVCFFVPQLPARQPCHSWDPWSLAKERWMWVLPIHP